MPAFVPPDRFSTRPTLRGSFGMVASTHWTASAVGQAVLERGGNAFDAGVAAAFTLHIVEPHLNGVGGDVVAVFCTAAQPRPQVLMGQGPAPAGATIEHMRAEGLELVPGAGALAAAVPGAFDAWLLLLRDHGTWELSDVLGYAIGYARHGHPLSAGAHRMIGVVVRLFREHWPSSAQQWLPGARRPAVGARMRLPALADTLERLVAAGASEPTREGRIDAARTEWASGFVATEIQRFLRTPHRHSTGTHHRGVLTAADLAAFQAEYEPAVTGRFRGWTIAKAGSWAQGPVLLQVLQLLSGFAPEEIDPASGIGAHRIVEALKLAMADRDSYYGDAAHDRDRVLDHLLSSNYADERRALIGAQACFEYRPGVVPGRSPYLPPLQVDEALGDRGRDHGEPTVSAAGQTRGDTCHVDVADRWGNLLSATPSGGWLQSSPTVPALGFALGTRLQMTWLDPQAPSALRPGCRPRTTLSPTIVMREGVPVLACGSPGGDQQDQWQLLFLLRVLIGDYSLQEAIDAPAFNITAVPSSFWPRRWVPGGVSVEDRLPEAAITELQRRGHLVSRTGDWSLGRLSAVRRDPRSGFLEAAANPRGMQGYAVGR